MLNFFGGGNKVVTQQRPGKEGITGVLIWFAPDWEFMVSPLTSALPSMPRPMAAA